MWIDDIILQKIQKILDEILTVIIPQLLQKAVLLMTDGTVFITEKRHQ
jgi:hypothetical protein